ncbi:MAG: universal stress protein [Anaerovoracaceae bacterium]|jgi:K+-sensing histidine kinase KdpD
MRNVLVCVTQQKTCDRLIRYGKELAEGEGGDLYIVHVAHYELSKLGHNKETEALEYLYKKSVEYGAYFTVVRSNNVLATLASMVGKHDVSKVVIGESKSDDDVKLADDFKKMVGKAATLIIVPEEDEQDDDNVLH